MRPIATIHSNTALVIALGLATLGGYACGSSASDAANNPDLGDAGLDATTSGGSDGGGDGSLQSDGGIPGVTTCGGQPCANFTGPKDFIQPGAPPNAPDLFVAPPQTQGSGGAKEPAIVYPNHETMFPINVAHIRHEWTGGTGNNLYKLLFEGPKTTVSVYTTNANWEPSDVEWDWIAESNRGGEVKFTVFAVAQAAPQSVWQSKSITLAFSDSEVEGAIYYWATGTKGVMKALVSDKTPTKFYTDPAAPDGATCVACHTLSRDGKRLAVGYNGEKLWQVSVPKRERILPTTPGQERASAWTTFSPDGKKLLVAAKGVLTLIDSDTGATIGPNNGIVPLPPGKLGTNPDWSALGDKVVIALGTKGGDKAIEGAEIAILPYDNGTWGAAQTLVPVAGAGDNNFFPSFSPDSQWIAYANAQGKSKDALSATLKLVRTAGGAPVTLVRLNGRVNNKDGVTGIGNSMPTWAPSTKPGLFWLAFSSLRAYATVRPQDAKEDQIWIAAVDPTKGDPAYSAFWAPFQSADEGNHRAFWTHTDTDKQCSCVEKCGDGIDNNCNGAADEPGCSTCGPVEICGNGLDDNCDCVIDNCGSVEICGNGIDDDGDDLIDTQDPQCAPK